MTVGTDKNTMTPASTDKNTDSRSSMAVSIVRFHRFQQFVKTYNNGGKCEKSSHCASKANKAEKQVDSYPGQNAHKTCS